MLDGMPAQKRGKEDEGAPAENGEEDRVSALPDELLHQVLSLVPAEEAVRTYVLAKRWRHLWKSTPGLQIGCLRNDEPMSVAALVMFVDRLFLLREASPLGTCKLRIGDFFDDGDVDSVNLWFRQAIACKIRELTQWNGYPDPWLPLVDLPLVSQYLTTLKLHCVECRSNFLDFASCGALEHLEFDYCDLSWAVKISSKSIKSLSIINSAFLVDDRRVRIYAPNLVSLHLDQFWGRTPILEDMPSLVEAFVRVDDDCYDCCDRLCVTGQDCSEYCDSGNISNGSSVLLKGLSKARKLVLISEPRLFILKRDLRWCPTFIMLKTLLLNEYWCVIDDHRALACILEHSPVLEKLTLQLFSQGPDHEMEMKGNFSSTQRSSTISGHLKIVEIKCKLVDWRVSKVLKFLRTFHIRE